MPMYTVSTLATILRTRAFVVQLGLVERIGSGRQCVWFESPPPRPFDSQSDGGESDGNDGGRCGRLELIKAIGRTDRRPNRDAGHRSVVRLTQRVDGRPDDGKEGATESTPLRVPSRLLDTPLLLFSISAALYNPFGPHFTSSFVRKMEQ